MFSKTKQKNPDSLQSETSVSFHQLGRLANETKAVKRMLNLKILSIRFVQKPSVNYDSLAKEKGKEIDKESLLEGYKNGN